MVFGLVKRHVESLRLMLDTCHRYQIVLNLNKFIFCVPFGILLGPVVCKQGLMVDLAKIVVIENLEAPNTETYRILSKFIRSYAQITTPMEKLLKQDATLCWDE